MKRIILLLILSAGLFSSAYATDLLNVYQQALRNDPTLAAACATRNANSEALPQSVATLLPNFSGQANVNTQNISGFSSQTAVNASSSANTHSYELALTQPIINIQNWMQFRQAENTVKEANATYVAALQQLIIRVATAYFNVLQAQDTLRFTEAEKTATGKQLQQIKDRYQVGLSTMTDVYQAQATYDNLTAQEITAQNAILNNMQALAQITGQIYPGLASLRATYPLVSPDPDDPTRWVTEAEEHNWQLQAAIYAEQAAKENIRVNFAGHFPTIAAFGAYQKGNNVGGGVSTGSTSTGAGASGVNTVGFGATNNIITEKIVGLQMNVPLFEGGLVMSQTRQAQDQYEAAADQMEITHRQVVYNTQESYNNVIASISKINADRLAVTSAQSALDSTQAGYTAGTKTILDVLTAEQNLYQAQTNYSADEYAYINNTLALKQAIGSLNVNDVIQINNWLQENSL